MNTRKRSFLHGFSDVIINVIGNFMPRVARRVCRGGSYRKDDARTPQVPDRTMDVVH